MPDEFEDYWKAAGRMDPRDLTVKAQMRVAFRAGVKAAGLSARMTIAAEINACADTVEAAGCACVHEIFGVRLDFSKIGGHGPRCPINLAAKIRERSLPR